MCKTYGQTVQLNYCIWIDNGISTVTNLITRLTLSLRFDPSWTIKTGRLTAPDLRSNAWNCCIWLIIYWNQIFAKYTLSYSHLISIIVAKSSGSWSIHRVEQWKWSSSATGSPAHCISRASPPDYSATLSPPWYCRTLRSRSTLYGLESSDTDALQPNPLNIFWM